MRFLPLIVATAAILLEPRGFAAPDRAQFIRECLDPTATRETPKFDDYTEGSYHVDKLDVVEGLEAATKSQPGRLRAVIILGPTGPLWTYYVLVALSDGDAITLNSLVMPHARITGKGTKTLSKTEFEQLFNKLTASKLLRQGEPSEIKKEGAISRDFRYDLFIVSWPNGRRSSWFAELEKTEGTPAAKDAEAVSDNVNAMLKGSKGTYTYPKEQSKRGSTKT